MYKKTYHIQLGSCEKKRCEKQAIFGTGRTEPNFSKNAAEPESGAQLLNGD